MKTNKAYKFRLYPTSKQRVMLNKTFGCVRFIYNQMLADRIAHYKATGESLKNTPAQYKSQFPWLKEVDCQALCNAQLHLNAAYSKFFSDPKEYGFPNFKSKKRNKASYTTNNQPSGANGTIRIEGNKIRLPKVGMVRFVQHRNIPCGWVIKSATVSKTSTDKYYISVLFEYENQVSEKMPRTFVGLDYSMPELCVASEPITQDGHTPKYPKFYRNAQDKLTKEQRKLSYCQKGSKNREKQRRKVAKCHERVANQRRDFLHKLSYKLANTYDVVCIENLNMQAMSQSLNYGKSVHDNGWGMFTAMLAYKLAERGGQLVKVDKFFPSSQLCHVCGHKSPEVKDLSVREWDCPQCGVHHDRDINAAINICNEGKRLLSA